MTVPTKSASATTSNTTGASPQAINLPTGISAGDLLVIIISARQGSGTRTASTPSGWTQLFNATFTANANFWTAAFYKIASGSEGSTVSVASTSGTAYTVGAVAYRFATNSFGSIESAISNLSGSGTTYDPPSISPSWGSFDDGFLAGAASAQTIPTAAPTGYSNLITANGNNNNPGIGCSDRTATSITTEDPASASINGNAERVAFTIAIEGIASATTFDKSLSATCATAASLVSALAIRAVLAQVACSSSIALRRAVTAIRSVSSATNVARTNLMAKIIALAAATATAATKARPVTLSMAVSTAAEILSSRGKTITIAVHGSVSIAKAMTKTIAFFCLAQVIRAVSSGLFPTIRKQRPRLQKSREDEPRLNRFR